MFVKIFWCVIFDKSLEYLKVCKFVENGKYNDNLDILLKFVFCKNNFIRFGKRYLRYVVKSVKIVVVLF